MSGRIFVDSNIILYLFTNDERKKAVAIGLLNTDNLISTQVVGENVNVCLKKLKLGKEEAFAHGRNLMDCFTVVNIYPSTIAAAFDIATKYGFSFWDSLIISTAIENNCETLYSEDMHNGLLIENKLTITNPF